VRSKDTSKVEVCSKIILGGEYSKRIKHEDKAGKKEGYQFDMKKHRNMQKKKEGQSRMQKQHVDIKVGK
jgi:hypothetical protein